jgi:microcystin-dependent protein
MPIDELTGGPDHVDRPLTNRGVVMPTPPGEDVRVRILEVGVTHYYEIPTAQWTGAPAEGQECLVVFDDQGDAWGVVPGSGAPGPPGPTGATGSTGPTGATGPAGPGVVPTGVCVPFAGSSAPAGFLLCDGASYLRSTYAALFAVIGTTFGAADGTHFNVPDFTDRMPLGASGSHARGSTGGAATVTLTVSEIPSHNHGGGTGTGGGSHRHTITNHAVTNNTVQQMGAGGAFWMVGNAYQPETEDTNIDHTHTISSQGGGGSHNNLPPFLAVPWVIAT